MTTYEKTLARLRSEYAANLHALEASKHELDEYDKSLSGSFNHVNCCVIFGKVTIWATEMAKSSLMNSDADLVRPIQFIGNKPLFSTVVDGVRIKFTEKE